MARRTPNDQFLFHTLRQREIGGKGRGIQSATILSRRTYLAITPNETLHKVELPDSFVPRRFTPDGKLLIGFTRPGDGIRVYLFRYPCQPAAQNNGQSPSEYALEEQQPADGSTKPEPGTFDRYFTIQYQSHLIEEQRFGLCKEFCIITKDHQYTGQIIDRCTFLNDYIALPQHAGVSLYQNTLAIMSVQNQTIHLLQIMSNGHFRKLRSIGWFNNETEEDLLQQFILREESYREQKNRSLSDRGIKRSAAAADLTTEEYNEHVYIPDSTARSPPNPRLLEVRRQNLSADTTLDDITDGEADEDDDEHEHSGRLKESPGLISGFRQKFMTYIYRKAVSQRDGGTSLRHFYCNFDAFASMKLWRVQLLCGHKLLVKLNNVTHALGRQAETSMQMAVFVIYNMATTEVEDVFDHSSSSVLEFYEEHADILRGLPHDGITWHGSTYTNSEVVKDTLKRQMYVWRYTMNGGRAEAMRRMSLSLPQCPQSYLECPYFDQSLFNFDEKYVSSLDG
ncbi:unnamed protein product [Umbelopsis sp. WA50703]